MFIHFAVCMLCLKEKQKSKPPVKPNPYLGPIHRDTDLIGLGWGLGISDIGAPLVSLICGWS